MSGVALYDASRHEPLRPFAWDEGRCRATIERIVRTTEAGFTEDRYWPTHPLDSDGAVAAESVETPLYHGACGVFWALHYLQAVGAATLSRSYAQELDRLLSRNRAWLGESAEPERASFMMGDTPIRMLAFAADRTGDQARALETLITGNIEHPSRELMWGSPGTLLAALFLYELTATRTWSELFRLTAARLFSELEWSSRYQCSYWPQQLYGRRSTYLGAAHGFVAAALPLIRGRHLLDAANWHEWQRRIIETVERTADRDEGRAGKGGTRPWGGPAGANWRPELDSTSHPQKRLLQFCHGAPGFVVCLSSLPSAALDDLLLAAGETIWSAGPLTKGSNLCHGTGGNGYAFLKLFVRTRDSLWLERARSFAMHGISQTVQDAARYGRLRYSLWTGDLGFAIYLWDCMRAQAQWPTLDVF